MASLDSHFRLGTCSAIVAVHLLALFAPLHVSAAAVATCLVLYFATLCVGITLGYHRMLAHGSFDAHPAVQFGALLLGALALQGGPLSWVEAHREHHAHADRRGDPHSPDGGFLWSHVLWLFWRPGNGSRRQARTGTDSLARVASFVQRHFAAINLLAPVLFFGTLCLTSGPSTAFTFFVWAFPVRIVAVWHATWLVNSATHRWGYRRYFTRDNSRNNPVVALATFGEGWHNNHHYNPRSARHGHTWYEVDITYYLIRTLMRLGLVWNLREQRRPAEAV